MANKFHFSAGFELKSVRDGISGFLTTKEQFAKYDGLRRSLSSFIVTTDCELNGIPEGRDNRFAFVLHNLIIRGIPTLASFGMEEQLRYSTGAIDFRESKTQGLEHSLKGRVTINNLLRALHFIEPRVNRSTAYENYLISWEDHGSQFEEKYLYEELPKRTFNGSGDFLIQLFQPQRSIGTIVPEGRASNLEGGSFNEQHVDFALEYPYPVSVNKRKGFCIEIDGSQHEEPQQRLLDNRRDDALLESGWLNTIRLKTNLFTDYGLTSHFNFLNQNEFKRDLFTIYYNNYKKPLYQSSDGLQALELVITPYAVARIQFVLVKAVISGYLSFDEDKWKICILERDVPCGRLAIEDFKQILEAFSRLEDKQRKFPQIELSIFYTGEFDSASLRQAKDLLVDEIGNDKTSYDIFIDISVLERDGLSKRHEAVTYDSYFQIRSSYHVPQRVQPFLSSKRILWGNLVIPHGEDKWHDHPVTSKALEFFIQNFFRKKSFRDGQLRILDRALRNKTVIGLLPTGGGKSLTYQLAGILQPGHVIVIDPIKSLMKDQVDSLSKIGITGTVYINSSLKDFEARNKAQNKLANGEALFCFVSPERLMIEKFRNSLASMANESHYFSYGVIDEVHCVSEWGHNFRTPYLSLGRNLIDFCKAEDGDIALFGLTATASFDVLADVQRELSGNRENQMIPDEAVVRYENTNRDELQYYIERVSLKNDQIEELRKQSKGPFFKISLSKAIGILKQHKINEILLDPGALIRRFNVKAENVVQEELLELTYSPENRPTLTLIHDKIKIPERSYQGNFWDYRDEEGNNNAALIFAPHKSWYFGVTDKYRQDDRRSGIAESIKRANILPQEKIGTFLGVDSDHEAVVKRMQEDNDRNQEDFVNGSQQLMVATKAFGMGIDKPNIRLTIHNNFPDSIESFVQEAGRGGRDRKLSVACVLYNDQEVQDPLRDKLYRHDFDLQESFLWNSFKGEEHEKRTLYELLNEIIFPGRDRINQLTKILNEHPDLEKLGYEVWVKHYDVKNRLYVNGPEKRDLGYIDYKEGTLIAKWSNVDPEISLMVLDALWSIVQDLAINLNPSFLEDWLNESQGSEKRNGIEKVLDKLKFGDHFEILVPFENDHTEIYNELAELVVKLLEISLTETTTINRYERYCKDHYHVKAEAFLENLNRDLRIIEKLDQLMLSNLDEANGFRRKLQNLLNRKRDKADTEKAIFRFSVIGLIDDYTVDYNSETYILKGIKKFSEQYNEALRFYISKYYSQKRTDKIIDSLSERRGNSHIQKILNFVTDFVYTEVAKKRFESISFMRECCKVGLERGNVDMKTWIHLYFNSKYARKGYSVKIEDEYLVIFSNLPLMQIAAGEYNASLLDWTNEGQEEEFDFVLDFMHLIEFDRSNSERDNLKHLRGACTRFIIANPDNYVFRLLRAFSVLLLEEGNLKDSVKIGVLEDLKRGYINLSERENEEFDLGEAMVHYKAAMNDKLQNLAAKEWFLDILQNLEFLAHVEWTNKFKQRFTNDLVI